MVLKLLLVALLGGIIITTGYTWNLIHTNPSSVFKELPQQFPSPSPLNSPSTYQIEIPKASTIPSSLPTPSPAPKIDITTAPSGEITIEITEEALNNQIKSSLIGQSLGTTPLGEANITDANIKINNGFLLITGTAKNGFVTLPLQTTATLELKDNQPKINLSDLSLNNIVLPQIIADQLTAIIQNKMNNIINSYNFKLKSISLETGKIKLVGEK